MASALATLKGVGEDPFPAGIFRGHRVVFRGHYADALPSTAIGGNAALR
jgi:hypothetical protein